MCAEYELSFLYTCDIYSACIQHIPMLPYILLVSLFREAYWVWYGNPLRSTQSAMHIPLRMERNVPESNWPFVKWIKPATTTIECSMGDLLFRCQRDAFNHLGCVEMRTWFTVDKILQQLGRLNIYSYVYNLLGIFTCTLYIYIYQLVPWLVHPQYSIYGCFQK